MTTFPVSAPTAFFQGYIADRTLGTDLQAAVQQALAAVATTGSSVTAAAGSATAAATSAGAASTSASAASTSAGAAATSASASAASATTAGTAATTATTQATNASNSATTASTQATNATTQATNASNSATNASTSATNAATSATSAASAVVSALSGYGRNYAMNGNFNVTQRGTGPFTTSGYTADRWQVSTVGGTISTTIASLSQTDRQNIGVDSISKALVVTFTGSAGSTDFVNITHNVENQRLLSGKTVAVSFYAKAASGTPKLGAEFVQNFGTGGSPTNQINAVITGPSTLTTNWARFTVTGTLVTSTSLAYVFGTNDDSYVGLVLWLSAGSALNARSSTTGQQSNTVSITGIQIEPGSVATPLEVRPRGLETTLCQRFAYAGNVYDYGTAAGFGTISNSAPFPATMRATPTISGPAATGLTGFTLAGSTASTLIYIGTSNASTYSVTGTFLATADL